MIVWFQKIISSEIVWLRKDTGSVNKLCLQRILLILTKYLLSSLSNHECIWRLEESGGDGLSSTELRRSNS